MDRFNTFSTTAKQSKADFAREAIRWYLDHYEEIKGQPRENATAPAIRYATDQLVKALNSGVDRLCKMLVRKGRAIDTLHELSWMFLSDDPNARRTFEEAANRARQKMARHVEKDERELADYMMKVVNS